MQCPVDGEMLAITERQGVEIDYCPKCRGVWLDRGELDKLIERSSSKSRNPSKVTMYDGKEPMHDDYYLKKRKKKSFLSEIFDFDF